MIPPAGMCSFNPPVVNVHINSYSLRPSENALLERMKLLTRSEAETKRRKAVEFLRRIGKDDDADRFEGMSPAEYAEHKGAELLENPFRRNTVAKRTKSAAQLEAIIEDLEDQVEDLQSENEDLQDENEALGEQLDQIVELAQPTEEDEDEDEG